MVQAAAPEIILLRQLKPDKSVELFVQHAGDFTADDIYQLILKDQNFPLDVLNSSFGKKLPHDIPEELKE